MRRIWTNYVRTVFIFAVLFLLSACKAELWDASQGPQEVALCASTAQTRTEMLSNGLSATWKSDDEIAVWAKNSSGSFVFSNQTFGVYGSGDGHGYFTSTLQSPMADGTYTYLCCYPKPESVNDGTKVTFTLPAEQDGKVSGGADIMIADPEMHGPLATVSEIEDGTGLSMKMNRMMHQFRFYIPEDVTALGDDHIRKIKLIFPRNVVGKVTYDLTNPSAAPVITDGSNVVTVTLDKGLVSTDENGRQYACVAILPTKFEAGESVEVKAYTSEKIAKIDPINLQARNFIAGHSTPVKLNVKGLLDYAGVFQFKVNENNLGEAPNSITFTAPTGCKWGEDGSNVFEYKPKNKIQVGDIIEVVFEVDLDAYKAFSSQNISVKYDSEHAILTENVTMPVISKSGKTQTSLAVPYLLYQDFSGILKEGESYGNNSYASDERKQPGVSLNGIMPENGWNAARFWMKPSGGAIRLNVRYQMVKIFFSFTTSHYGRLDTPPLSALKPGVTANLKVSFDAGANVNSGSDDDAEKGNLTFINMTTHENSSNPINGVGTGTGESGDIKNFGAPYYTSAAMPNVYGADDFLNTYPTHTVTGVEATNATRLCFYPSTAFNKDGICNAEFNVYIDNIKVQIDN